MSAHRIQNEVNPVERPTWSPNQVDYYIDRSPIDLDISYFSGPSKFTISNDLIARIEWLAQGATLGIEFAQSLGVVFDTTTNRLRRVAGQIVHGHKMGVKASDLARSREDLKYAGAEPTAILHLHPDPTVPSLDDSVIGMMAGGVNETAAMFVSARRPGKKWFEAREYAFFRTLQTPQLHPDQAQSLINNIYNSIENGLRLNNVTVERENTVHFLTLIDFCRFNKILLYSKSENSSKYLLQN